MGAHSHGDLEVAMIMANVQRSIMVEVGLRLVERRRGLENSKSKTKGIVAAVRGNEVEETVQVI